MSADIEKIAVVDSRIVQSRPKYAVDKGALSLTNAPFNAIAATSSQHTYNIYVPSENVFVDRKLLWSSSAFLTFNVALAAVPVAGASVVVPGRDFALCSFPLNSLCSTMSATINDTTSVINTQDVLREVLRLTDYKKNRLQRTCPTMLDKYMYYDDAYQTLNNPLGGYDASTDYDNVPNGAFNGLQFTAADGSILGTAAPAFAGALYDAVNGVPVANAATIAAQAAGTPIPIYIKFRSTESLVLSPFVFADEHEWDTGLFGINNIQLIMNLQSSPARLIRATQRGGVTVSGVSYNGNVAAGVFERSVVNVQFLTPSLEVPLPPKSVVPYMEFPRYITQYSSGQLAPGAITQVASQTITLPQIPDLLLVYAKPKEALNPGEADFYFPLATSIDGINNPLSINFDNFSGLLSSHTSEELYAMSVKNGLDMDWQSFSGQGRTASGSYPAPAGLAAHQQGQITPLVGSMLVLKPSQDITLQSGQSPSLVGNFTLQFNIQLKNTAARALTPMLYVVTVNSGFFESIRGSSRIIKGVLSEQDIINAPLAPMMLRDQLDRMVGGLSLGKLGSMLSKVKGFYEKTKPIMSAVRGALPEDGMMGKVKGAMGAVGYGMSGGAESGGARSGGRKGLAARLL
jgi:hypothetical protein